MRTVNEIYNIRRKNCKDESDHIQLIWIALNNCDNAEYEKIENGDGVIHQYTFKKGEEPKFLTVSNDIFNQIRIVVVD
jgi:hypothetical protein